MPASASQDALNMLILIANGGRQHAGRELPAAPLGIGIHAKKNNNTIQQNKGLVHIYATINGKRHTEYLILVPSDVSELCSISDEHTEE